jgi:hypothetical protein
MISIHPKPLSERKDRIAHRSASPSMDAAGVPRVVHRVLRAASIAFTQTHEGASLGILVATTTWTWIALVDLVVGDPLHTFSVLGGVGLYTLVHFALCIVYGIALTSMVRSALREPSLILAVVFGIAAARCRVRHDHRAAVEHGTRRSRLDPDLRRQCGWRRRRPGRSRASLLHLDADTQSARGLAVRSAKTPHVAAMGRQWGQTPRHGSNSRQMGSAPRQWGQTPRQRGQTPRQWGQTPRQWGQTPKHGSNSRQLGSAPRRWDQLQGNGVRLQPAGSDSIDSLESDPIALGSLAGV